MNDWEKAKNATKVVKAASAPEVTSKGDQLLESASRVSARLSGCRNRLSTVLQRIGTEADESPKGERDEGYGFLGRMEMTLRDIYDICDDLEEQTSALEELF